MPGYYYRQWRSGIMPLGSITQDTKPATRWTLAANSCQVLNSNDIPNHGQEPWLTE